MKSKRYFVEAVGTSREKISLADAINRLVDSLKDVESSKVEDGVELVSGGFGRALVTVTFESKSKK